MSEHITVLKEEAVDALNIKDDGIYVDATLGGGGHSSLILSKLKKGHLYSFDQDDYAISMQSKSFSYSRKLGTARANKLQIMLPVDDNNEPDYEFMEECGRKIMAKKYIQYLKYLESTCESSDLLLKWFY